MLIPDSSIFLSLSNSKKPDETLIQCQQVADASVIAVNLSQLVGVLIASIWRQYMCHCC